MTPQNTIVSELKELNSSLIDTNRDLYTVPEGYFDALPGLMMQRIRALEAVSAAAELDILSPLVASLPRQMPYKVPAGYFEELGAGAATVASLQEKAPHEELEALSPLLGGLKKEMPYQVPAGYFDSVIIPGKAQQTGGRVIPLTSRKWFRYAVAASVTLFVGLSAVFYASRSSQAVDPATDSYAWVQKNLKNVSTDDLQQFVEMTGGDAAPNTIAAASTGPAEVKDLLKNVSEKEIQDFLSDISPDDVLIN